MRFLPSPLLSVPGPQLGSSPLAGFSPIYPIQTMCCSHFSTSCRCLQKHSVPSSETFLSLVPGLIYPPVSMECSCVFLPSFPFLCVHWGMEQDKVLHCSTGWPGNHCMYPRLALNSLSSLPASALKCRANIQGSFPVSPSAWGQLPLSPLQGTIGSCAAL